MADPQESRQSSNAIFLQVLALYGVIGAAVWLVASRDALLWACLAGALALPVIGWCQLALFNALHEGLHRRFGRPHREFAAYALCAWPLGFDASYRQVHLDHHRFFGDPERDPDYPNYADFPSTRGALLRRLLYNLSGLAALRQVLGGGERVPASHGGGAGPDWLRLLAGQAVVLALFAITVGWPYYLLLWLLPLATFAKFFTATRTFCEHGSPSSEAVIRTITGSPVGEKILGPFSFHYHAEHHHRVAIPYDQLVEAHATLRDHLYGDVLRAEARYELYEGGYLGLLHHWYRTLPG